MSDREHIILAYRFLLGRICRKEVPLKRISAESWADTYAGNVEFEADGWRLVFFNDCDSLDYTDHLITPSGVRIDFYEKEIPVDDPLSLAEFDLNGLLEDRLKEAA